MVARRFVAPSQYIQGPDELIHLGRYVRELIGGSGLGSGRDERRALLVASREDRERVAETLVETQRLYGVSFLGGDFNGRCTEEEVARLCAAGAVEGCRAVIGLGGGRSLDAAKAAAHGLGLPAAVVPTVASTDGPCSSIAVIYKESGELSRYLQLSRPPELVLADTAIIARATVRFLVAGMGDALSTWFEARANERARAVYGRPPVPQAALAAAEACYRVLRGEALAARAACEAKRSDESLERVVEANLLLSSLAFEGCGLAAAHAVHNGLTVLEETRPYLHGEIVAFCTLVQLRLEQASEEEREAAEFCRLLGLPSTLADIGLGHAGPDRLRLAAEAACSPEGPMGNMPFSVDPAAVVKAMCEAGTTLPSYRS